jgi:predicted small lipoprotein YifL
MFASASCFHVARLVVLALSLAVVLAGCGKKGPLVPPNGDQPPARQAPSTPVR